MKNAHCTAPNFTRIFWLKKCTAAHSCQSITLSKCPIMKAIYYVFSFSNSVFVLTALSRWTWVSRYENVSILDFIGAKDDGGGGDNWSYKTWKAPVKSSPVTNQHPTFYRSDALPVVQSTVSEHWREFIFLTMDKTFTRLLCGYFFRLNINRQWVKWSKAL